MRLSTDHECACEGCSPKLTRLPERLGENHFSTLFEDHWRIAVNLDGTQERYCYECMAGEQGWVKRHRQPVHLCSCGEGVCTEQVVGYVEAYTFVR